MACDRLKSVSNDPRASNDQEGVFRDPKVLRTFEKVFLISAASHPLHLHGTWLTDLTKHD